MLSRLFVVAPLLLTATVLAIPAHAQSSTIRIEPRPYYGATVTVEQGVRVWRPLPPVSHMIINPNNATPLNLNLADVRETVTSRSDVHVDRGGEPGDAVVGSGTFRTPFARGRFARINRNLHGRFFGPGLR